METKILLPWFVTGLILAFAAFFVGRWLKRRFAPKSSKRENVRVGLIAGALILTCHLVMRLLAAGHILTYSGVSGYFGSGVAQFFTMCGCFLGPLMADDKQT